MSLFPYAPIFFFLLSSFFIFGFLFFSHKRSDSFSSISHEIYSFISKGTQLVSQRGAFSALVAIGLLSIAYTVEIYLGLKHISFLLFLFLGGACCYLFLKCVVRYFCSHLQRLTSFANRSAQDHFLHIFHFSLFLAFIIIGGWTFMYTLIHFLLDSLFSFNLLDSSLFFHFNLLNSSYSASFYHQFIISKFMISFMLGVGIFSIINILNGSYFSTASRLGSNILSELTFDLSPSDPKNPLILAKFISKTNQNISTLSCFIFEILTFIFSFSCLINVALSITGSVSSPYMHPLSCILILSASLFSVALLLLGSRHLRMLDFGSFFKKGLWLIIPIPIALLWLSKMPTDILLVVFIALVGGALIFSYLLNALSFTKGFIPALYEDFKNNPISGLLSGFSKGIRLIIIPLGIFSIGLFLSYYIFNGDVQPFKGIYGVTLYLFGMSCILFISLATIISSSIASTASSVHHFLQTPPPKQDASSFKAIYSQISRISNLFSFIFRLLILLFTGVISICFLFFLLLDSALMLKKISLLYPSLTAIQHLPIIVSFQSFVFEKLSAMDLANFFSLSLFSDDFWTWLFVGSAFILFIVSQILNQSKKNLNYCIDLSKKEINDNPDIFEEKQLPDYIHIINSFISYASNPRAIYLPLICISLLSVFICILSGIAGIIGYVLGAYLAVFVVTILFFPSRFLWHSLKLYDSFLNTTDSEDSSYLIASYMGDAMDDSLFNTLIALLKFSYILFFLFMSLGLFIHYGFML